ncbi:MAG: DUF2169 domain-containing protein, partial [Gammaproteobacteria bacterium]|nr:DUF2169 domain-containing protein [Gammaproteobacteria bacterium]
MKAIKPLSLGLLHKPYRFDGRERMVIVALGFFRLGAENGEFLGEPAQWPEVLKRLPAEQPLDMVMPKPRGEVLAAATAYAPAGKPVTQMSVRVQVGDIDKHLLIVGDRGWRYGTVPLHGIDAPARFSTMAIDWSRAYGGPAHPGNPIGQGHTGSRFGAFVGVNQGAMPNIEYPKQRISGHHQALPPAGFGPIDIRWAPRNQGGGSYDPRWLKEQAPGLPLDIDWSVFNAAPADQRIEGYFQGGETYRLEGLHPDKPLLEGRLPALRVRAFANFAEGGDAIEEVAMQFDTVWLFPDAELGLALYRGELTVAESDAADLAHLLLAYENQADAPRPAAHYQQALQLRLQGRDALAHIANEAPLKPELDAAARAHRVQEQADAEAEVLARSQVLLDAAHADLGEMNGGGAPPKASLPPLGVLPKAALLRGDADIAAVLARADAQIAQARAEGERKLEELEAVHPPLEKGGVNPQATTTADSGATYPPLSKGGRGDSATSAPAQPLEKSPPCPPLEKGGANPQATTTADSGATYPPLSKGGRGDLATSAPAQASAKSPPGPPLEKGGANHPQAAATADSGATYPPLSKGG